MSSLHHTIFLIFIAKNLISSNFHFDRGGQVPHTQLHNQIHTSSLQSLPIPPPLLDISPCCTPDGKNHQTRRCGSCLSDDGQRQEDCHEKKACDLLSGCPAGISQVFSSYHLFLPFTRLSHLLFLSFFTLLVYGMTWHDMIWYDIDWRQLVVIARYDCGHYQPCSHHLRISLKRTHTCVLWLTTPSPLTL